jgi:hypothetical protein
LREIGVTHLIHSPPTIGFDVNASGDEMIRVVEQLSELSR